MTIVALLVLGSLGSLGAAGAFLASPSLWWAALGLSVCYYACNPVWTNVQDNKSILFLEGLMVISFVAIGVLGATGHLTNSQAGWGIIGTYLANFSILLINNGIQFRERLREIKQQAAANNQNN